MQGEAKDGWVEENGTQGEGVRPGRPGADLEPGLRPRTTSESRRQARKSPGTVPCLQDASVGLRSPGWPPPRTLRPVTEGVLHARAPALSPAT